MTASHNSEFFQAFHAFTNFIELDALNDLSLLQFTVKGPMKRRRHNKFKWKRGDFSGSKNERAKNKETEV